VIQLINGHVTTAAGLFVPFGSIVLTLNVDATVVNSPNGVVCASIPITFQLDANGDLVPPARLFSNYELNPQNSLGLGTYYLVQVLDQQGTRVNKLPMCWQFTEAAGSVVDISQMIPFAPFGESVVFYPASLTSLSASVFLGAYDSGTSYVPNNQVTFDSDYYICILATTGNDPTNATYWQIVSTLSTETYLGAYSSGTAYVDGNEVSYLGNFYICISASTGNAPSPTSIYWTLLGTSAILLGAYSGSTAYVAGNEVTYLGGYYICILATTGHVPTNATYWQVVSVSNASIFLGAYSGSTAYAPGNQVSYLSGYYICILATTGNLPSNATYWQIVSTPATEMYLGTYDGSTSYVDGNEVSYLGSFWICISPSTGHTPTTVSTYWTLLGTSAILIGAYDAAVAYVAGNQVTYSGGYYTCILATTGHAPTNGTYWVAISVPNSSTFLGAYAGGTTYIVGNQVTYAGGYYICILTSTGNLPSNVTYWQLISSTNANEFLGAYSGATAYVAGNQVTYSGGYYINILASTGNLPTNATYWQSVSIASNDLYMGAYNSGTSYVDGNQVSYLGGFWICISPATGDAPSTASAYWTLLGTSAILIGAYDASVTYIVGHQVTYLGGYYTCILTTVGHVPTNATYWTAISVQNNNVFLGAYAGGTAYLVGNEVTYSSGYYKCILATTGNLPTNATYWVAVSVPSASEYLGAYDAGTGYVIGNQITSGGAYWICIAAVTGTAPPNATYWQLVATTNTDIYLGTYNSGTAYLVGNQVSYLGSFYICISAGTGNTPSTTSAYWTLVGTSAILIGAYSGSVAYVPGNQVTYLGGYYTNILASTGYVPTNATYWTAISVANNNVFLGAYNSGTGYLAGNEVTYLSGYYKCILASTGNAPTNATYWVAVSLPNGSEFLGAYNSGTAYVIGNQITSGGSYWICIAAVTGTAPPNATYWQLVATTNNDVYLGAYSGATAYVVGNQVSYQGSFWICVSGTTGNAPSTAVLTYWTLVGTNAVLIGTYSSGVDYLKGQQVVYAGNYYTCILATTGNAPTNATYWQLVSVPAGVLVKSLTYVTATAIAWDSGLSYSIGDVVTYSGYVYTAILASTGYNPNAWNGVYWSRGSSSSTPSYIKWSWTGVTIYTQSGGTVSVADGSQVVTNLLASTTYYFFPYYDLVAAAVVWVTTSGAYSAGSPVYASTYAFGTYVQAMSIPTHLPLSAGAMEAATLSSGAGGGSGGGDGGGGTGGIPLLS